MSDQEKLVKIREAAELWAQQPSSMDLDAPNMRTVLGDVGRALLRILDQ